MPLIFAVDFFAPISKFLSEVALKLLEANMYMIHNAPDPNVMSVWFISKYSSASAIALYLMVPIVLAATFGVILRGSLAGLFHTYVIGTAVAIFGSMVALSVVTICIAIDAEMVEAITNGPLGTTENVRHFTDALANSSGANEAGAVADPGTTTRKIFSPILYALCMIVMIVGCLFMLLELVFRQVMIYMSVLFLPLSFAAYIWGPIRIWLYMLAEICVSMIFAKFIVAAIAGFGFQALAIFFVGDNSAALGAGSGENVTGSGQWGLLVGGAFTLFAACCAIPALIAFVMQPTHAVLQRKAVWGQLPMSNKNTYARRLLGSGRALLFPRKN